MTSQSPAKCVKPPAVRVARMWRTGLAGVRHEIHGTETLRQVRMEDADAVAALCHQAFLGGPDEAALATWHAKIPLILQGGYGPFIEAASWVHESGARQIDAAILVAESATYGGPVVGVIAVAKPLHGGRLGRALLSHSLVALQQLGCLGCCARITVGHLRSEQLFQRFGFTPASR